MAHDFFTVHHQSKHSKARLGTITTDHGMIQTPAFVSVATKGSLKSMIPSLISETGTQVSFVNTYHLVTHPGTDIIAKAGGIHKFSHLSYPLMSDSGGFQVFSLGKKSEDNKKKHAYIRGEEEPFVLKISEDGVTFRSVYDGETVIFTPERSIDYQKQIGADMIMAFDECTYYPSTYEYTQKANMRTHQWLKRCIARMKNTEVISATQHQHLYGVIQGGTCEDLRKASAQYITAQDVNGVAIGGVSVGESKKEMRDQVRWVSEFLPQDKPVHLLGVGELDDIADLVGYGIDTFDCVEPTRLARMGIVYQWEPIRQALAAAKGNISAISGNLGSYKLDITKGIYKGDLSSIDTAADNYVTKNFSKAYLHHLLKQRELVGYTLATYHNLWIMEEIMKNIRTMIHSTAAVE